jgi:uncharacterized protein YyaL (SSP411 family)
MIMALDFMLGPAREIIIAGNADSPDIKQMLKLIRGEFMPNTVVLLHEPDKANSVLYKTVPFIKNQVAIEGKATAYVCENYACKKPVNNIDEFEKLIAGAPANK